MKGTPGNQVIYKDFQWFFISREFARYVLFEAPETKIWRNFFSNYFAPEESVLQTIAMNNRNFSRTLIWHQNNQHLIHGQMYADWDTYNCKSYKNPRPCCSPCYLSTKDLSLDGSELINSKWLFARKFYVHDKVRKEIFSNARTEEINLRRMKLIR